MMRGHFDTVHGVTVDKLVIGRVGRAVAVSMRVIVAARGCCRQVMLGAERAVGDERERRRDRQTGGEASAHQLGETNHPGTGIMLHWRDSNRRIPASPDRRRHSTRKLRVFGGIR